MTIDEYGLSRRTRKLAEVDRKFAVSFTEWWLESGPTFLNSTVFLVISDGLVG